MHCPNKLPRLTDLLDTWRQIEQHHQELAGLYTLAHQITTGTEEVPPKAENNGSAAGTARALIEAIEGELGLCVAMN